jgi:hypothetical protein
VCRVAGRPWPAELGVSLALMTVYTQKLQERTDGWGPVKLT